MRNQEFLDACRDGDYKTAEYLIDKVDINFQDNHGWTPLMIASLHGYIDIVDRLISMGADVNIKGAEGKTALMWASLNGYLMICYSLIMGGSEIDIKDECGLDVYDLAVAYNKIPIMFLLNPTVIHEKDENGNTLLISACLSLNENHIFFLYEVGADFYLENNVGESAISLLNDGLSPRLQSLKEGILLDSLIEYGTDCAESL